MATVKKLEKAKLARLQAAEKEMGYCLVAFEAMPGPATISEPQLKKVQSLEKELGAVIVAYECKE